MSATLYATQGKDFLEQASYLNQNGTAMNVTGHTSYIKMAKHFGAAQSSVITSNGTILNAAQGSFTYVIPKESINALKPGSYVYTRYLKNSSNEIINVVSGDIIVEPSIL